MTSSNLSNCLPISVVIPTLGDSCLSSTINHINSGPITPYEILICIPYGYLSRVEHLIHNNVKLVPTFLQGQVVQRIEGFKYATQPYVLQLDDDVEISLNSLTKLMKLLISLDMSSAVAPVFLDKVDSQNIHKFPNGLSLLFSNLFIFLLFGSKWGICRMGTVTTAGTNYGVDFDYLTCSFLEVEWVPGGCCLHHRQNLLLDSFYPFPGKAFCEDLIHSFYLRQRNIRLFVTNSAFCKIDYPSLPLSRHDIFCDIRARFFFNKLRGLLCIRFIVWCLLSYPKRFFIR